MKGAGSIREPVITPMFFPSGDGRLMGVHYAPPPRSERRGMGVLMCNQVGPDYSEYYKTGRMLVGMLAAKGFDCLRFDYTGCGDSEGGYEDASVRQWLCDITAAETSLREHSGCTRVCLCGFGLGGLLAAASVATSDAEALVLWEPVVDGQSYCRRLRADHKAWLRGSFVKAMNADRQFQAMGFPATADLERQIRLLRLADVGGCRAGRAFVIIQDGSSDRARVQEHLERSGVSVQSCDAPGKALPLGPMRAVATWLERGGDG